MGTYRGRREEIMEEEELESKRLELEEKVERPGGRLGRKAESGGTIILLTF